MGRRAGGVGRVARQPRGSVGAGRIDQPEPGAAVRAADWLGVEPAVGRVVVLRAARGAHREAGHRGQRPVVGHVPDDAEPWPAVGAVDERVAEPPVRRVSQFPQAVRAGRGVRGDQRAAAGWVAGHRLAGNDGEAGPAVRRDRLRGDPLHLGQRRCVPDQRGQEVLHPGRGPLHLGEHAVRVVAHPAGQAQPGSQGVHERAEPDPLDHALYPDGRPDLAGHGTQCARFPGPAAAGRPAEGGAQALAFRKMIAGPFTY